MENFIVYRFVRYELSSMGFVAPELNTMTVCPACPQVYKNVHLCDYVFPHTVRSMYASTSRSSLWSILLKEGTKILSFDALFGLYQKKHAGVSVRPPLYGTTFFHRQEEVDRFVQGYDTSDSTPDKVMQSLCLICGIKSCNYVRYIHCLYRAAISSWPGIFSDQKGALLLLMKPLFLEAYYASTNSLNGLSWKCWSGENIGPGDQNSRKNGPGGPFFSPENIGPALE